MTNRKRKDDRQRGFTLIEILVVLLIIVVLAAIAFPLFVNQRAKAQDVEAKTAARTALAIAAGENDLVRVWTVPHGSHGMLEAADPVWTKAVYRRFFERWATYAERGSAADRANGKLVYSEE